MSARTPRFTVPLLLAASLACAASAYAQAPAKDSSLGAARDLYASARYDEALAVLNDLRPSEGNATTDRRSIEQYRSLCLLALGRGNEAEDAIAQVVTADPAYLPNETDASPRVRAAFSDVRRKLLPDIVSKKYADAKVAFDHKDYVAAIPQFKNVMALIDDPDMHGRLADLRVLASGFLDLSVVATTPPPEPPKKEPVAPPPPSAPKADPNRIYTGGDRNVTAPVVIRQNMPSVPPAIVSTVRDRGIIEVVIDEQGRVSAIAMRESVHPSYDTLVMNAARDWRYQPATLGQTPVRYRKLIQINVTRQP
jgi:hypothetical protein